MSLVAGNASILEELLLAHRDLFGAEAKLAEVLARRGIRLKGTVADRWPVLHDHLHLYARGLGPAGVLVLAGAPDPGSRRTGIPFTGPLEARKRLGLDVEGEEASPSGEAFWRALGDAPLEALFGTVLLAHANPFDAPDVPEVREAARAHLARLLDVARPQVVVTVGAAALEGLGHVLHERDLVDLSHASESSWVARWPPSTPLLRRPTAEAPLVPPFRFRFAALPALDGALGPDAVASLAAIIRYVVA